MLETRRLDDVRRAIRRYLNALPDEEPVDLIFLATVLANFDPDRSLPHWLVIVGAPGVGKSKLVDTLAGWEHAFVMTNGISSGFFLSTKREVKESALDRIVRQRKRILLWSDIMYLTSIHRNNADAIHSQLIGVHDGYLYRESGLTGEPKIYRATDQDRLGFIAAGTATWYTFQRKYNAIGTRFSIYYWPRPHWAQTDSLEAVLNEERSEFGARYVDASNAVKRYLDEAIRSIHELRQVHVDPTFAGRIAAATAIVMRACTSPGSEGDSGRRVGMRAKDLLHILPFMDGRKEASEYDLQVVLRFVISQADAEEQRALRLAILEPHIGIDQAATLTAQPYQVARRMLFHLRDVGLLDHDDTRKPAVFRLSPDMRRLATIASIDFHAQMWTYHQPPQ